MKSTRLALTLILALTAAAAAQDDYTTPPASSQPQAKPEAPAPAATPSEPAKPAAPAATSPASPQTPAPKETPKSQAVKQEAPRDTTQTAPAKAEEPPAAEPEAARKAKAPAPKPMTQCAQALQPLADSYKQAYDSILKFMADVDVQTKAADERVTKLEKQIEENESGMTKAKLDGDNAKADDLEHQDKQLWKDLGAAKKERAAMCYGFSRDAKQKVREFGVDAISKLAECQERMK